MNKIYSISKILCLLFLSISLSAQFINPEAGPVFIDTEVPRIDINIQQEYIDAILDEVWSDEEYEAQFIFTSSTIQDTVENVGIRLRGNTSRGAGKKSIKVSFNTFKPGRKFYGLEKMNINGEHNDPSIIRSKISWDISNWVGVPATRSNHVALYLNDEYIGLYLNVEHIDEEFIAKRFDDKSGNLWKCLYPADLHYLGFDPDLYKVENFGSRTYDLKTNKTQDDYTKLAHFVNVLNNYSGDDFKCEIERIFDVNNYIKVIAMDILFSHWDGPISNKNNFYLYHDPCFDKIQFISYDLDNTFGIDWSGRDWTQISIYDWSSNSFDGEARPIYDQLMAVPEYQERFNHYMKEIIDMYFNETVLHPYLDEKLELIKSYRENDPLAGSDYDWDYDDFLTSYEVGIGDHVPKGMKEYITERRESALDELEQADFSPIVQDIEIDWAEDNVLFNIMMYDDQAISNATFYYSLDGINWMDESLAIDDNMMASYEFPVSEVGILSYYVEVKDNDDNSRFFPLCKDATERLGYLDSPKLIINEVMTSNDGHEADDFGEYQDWIELYNMSGTVLPIGQLHLSDDPQDPGKWTLPNTALSPNKYLIIWADGDPFQGDTHANFKLKKAGETLGLYDAKENHYRPINKIDIPEMETNYSYARKPNALGDFEIVDKPTFGIDNDLSSTHDIEKTKLKLYPNPAQTILHIDSSLKLEEYTISCVNTLGQHYPLSKDGNKISVGFLPNGIYTLLLQNNSGTHAKKFTIEK